MMSYMEMLPIVTQLTMLWGEPETAETAAKIAEMTARLPPKEEVQYARLLEAVAETQAKMIPHLRRSKVVETTLAGLQEELAALEKQAAVKWGPRRAANGETVPSLQAKIAAASAEIGSAAAAVAEFEEAMAPCRKLLEDIDQHNQDCAELVAWERRKFRGAVPACVTEMMERERADFLAVAEVLPPLRRGRA